MTRGNCEIDTKTTANRELAVECRADPIHLNPLEGLLLRIRESDPCCASEDIHSGTDSEGIIGVRVTLQCQFGGEKQKNGIRRGPRVLREGSGWEGFPTF